MTKHAMTAALENLDLDGLRAGLAPEVAFHSPVLEPGSSTLVGRDMTMLVLGNAVMGFGVPTNVAEYRGEDGHLMVTFDGVVGGHPLQVAVAMTEDADGKVTDIVVYMRPHPVVTLFRDHMRAAMSPDPVPDSAWDLPVGV